MHYSVCFILFLYSILIVESYVRLEPKNVNNKQVADSRRSNVIYCKYYATQEEKRAHRNIGYASRRHDLDRPKRHMMFRKSDFFEGDDSDSEYVDNRDEKTIKKDSATIIPDVADHLKENINKGSTLNKTNIGTEKPNVRVSLKIKENVKTDIITNRPKTADNLKKVDGIKKENITKKPSDNKKEPVTKIEKAETTAKISFEDLKIVIDGRRKMEEKSTNKDNLTKQPNNKKDKTLPKVNNNDGNNNIETDLKMVANHEFSAEVKPLHKPIPGSKLNSNKPTTTTVKLTTKKLVTSKGGHVIDDSSYESDSDKEFGPFELKLNKPWLQNWNLAIVPYYIDYKTYDTSLIEVILNAIDHMEKKSCIILRRLHDLPTDKYSLENIRHIVITNPTGTRQCVHTNEFKERKGQQIVTLGYDCMSQGEILHELLHVLGFSHEHNRPDRDKYVNIAWDNIKPGYKSYFEKRQEDSFISYPYDYLSLQHYPEKYFSKNGKNTISAKKNKVKVGESNDLSVLDIKKITTAFRGTCQERTKYYLENTCPIVLSNPRPNNSTMNDGIRDYYKERIWNLGIVNYELKNRNAFSIEEKEILKMVVKHIEELTCIEFRDISVPVDDSDNKKQKKQGANNRRYLYSVSNDNSTLSPVINLKPINTRRHTPYTLVLEKSQEKECQCPHPGKTMNEKVIKVSEHCFSDVNVLLHLFGHILGLDHQENAHDRDSYLFISWKELSPRLQTVLKPKLSVNAAAGFEYDYHSVMHMPWVTIDSGKLNIVYPIWSDGWAMGHSSGLSLTDVRKLSRLYKNECKRRKMIAKQILKNNEKDKHDIPFIVSLNK